MSSFTWPKGGSGGGGGGGTPAGSNTEVQYNDSGSFGASPGLTYDDTAKRLTVLDGIVVGDPVNGAMTQIAGSELVANGSYWDFNIYAVQGGFYSPTPLNVNATDDNSAATFDWEITWDAVPGAESYLVVIGNDDQNGYYGDWAFPVATNLAVYSGTTTPGLTSTFSTPTSTNAGEVKCVTLKVGVPEALEVDIDGQITLDTNKFIARPNGYTSVNTTSQDGRITIDDPTGNGRQLAMINSNGQQSTMVWIAPNTGGGGYYYMFGADVTASNSQNFFIWNLSTNTPIFFSEGSTNNVQLGNNPGVPTMGTLTSKVQVTGVTSQTTALFGVNIQNAGAKGIRVRGAASQTEKLIETLDNLSNVNFSVGPLGETQIGQLGAPMTAVVSATATLDFPSISAGAIQTLTITVTGAAVGGVVSLGPPSGINAGLMWSGFVSALNTVTIRLHNTTGSPIDPASATWRAQVTNF